MANVLEVLFKNSFIEVALGFFFVASWRNFAKKKNAAVLKLGILAIA
jgi:hypothetical protein